METRQDYKVTELLSKVLEPAFFLLLLIRLERLPSQVKLAKMLGIERRKVGRRLNQLIDLGFVRAVPGKHQYILNSPLPPAHQQVINFFTHQIKDTDRWFDE